MLFIPEYSIHIQIMLSHSYAIKQTKQTSMHVHIAYASNAGAMGKCIYDHCQTMFCRIVLHDLFVDVIKAYILFLISILHVGKPRDTNM